MLAPSWRPEPGDGNAACPSGLGTGHGVGVLGPPFLASTAGSVLGGLSHADCWPLPRADHEMCGLYDLFSL